MARAETNTGGRAATDAVVPGIAALSIGLPTTLPEPDGFKWTALSTVARLESGHTPSRGKPEYWGGDIPWIGIRDATGNHGRVLADTEQHVTQLGIDNSSARVLPPGTVCLSRTASVGYVVQTARPMATSQDFVNWVCGPELDPNFLRYVLMSEAESVRRFAYGSVHATMYYPDAKALHVLLPSLPEQQAVAEALGALDDKIAANTALATTADELIRAEYAGLNADRVRVVDVADSPRSGVDPSSVNPQDLYVGLEHVGRRHMWLTDGGRAEEVSSTKSRFEARDILFGKLRPYFHKVVSASRDGICSTDILVVRARDSRLSSVLLAALTSDAVIEEVVAASEGTRMPRTSWKDLASVEIRWPGSESAERLAARLDSIRGATLAVLAENSTLAATRDALLPELMSGRLRVRDAEAVASEVGA